MLLVGLGRKLFGRLEKQVHSAMVLSTAVKWPLGREWSYYSWGLRIWVLRLGLLRLDARLQRHLALKTGSS